MHIWNSTRRAVLTGTALAGLLLLLPITNVQAQYACTTNNNTLTITKYTGSGGSLSLPSKINGLSVTCIGDWAFQECDTLTNVYLPGSYTNVGTYAFYSCSNLRNVSITNGVVSIGEAAFDECSSLTNASLGNGCLQIGRYAFAGCVSLNRIHVVEKRPPIGD